MPNLCCVLDCRTGKGNNKAKVPLFRLPSDKDEPERRKKWICALVAKNNGYLSVSESNMRTLNTNHHITNEATLERKLNQDPCGAALKKGDSSLNKALKKR